MFNKNYLELIGASNSPLEIMIAVSYYFAEYRFVDFPLKKICEKENIKINNLLEKFPITAHPEVIQMYYMREVSYINLVYLLSNYFCEVLVEEKH